MNLAEEKKLLRKEFKEKRNQLSSLDVELNSKMICENFINNLLPKIYDKNLSQNFSLYLSANNEVETKIIAQHFHNNNINFSYPKILLPNHALEFVKAESSLKFCENKFFPKILEPENGEKIIPDILILPLLAFDDDLSRLGMGGGFFDRTIQFLKSKKSKIITIGLAYDIQRFHQKIPNENTDCALDFIITEKNIFLRS